MADVSSMQRNLAALTRCNKIYKYTTIPNLGAAAIIIAATFYSSLGSLLSGEWVNVIAFFVSMIVGVGACALAILGGYTKKDIVSVAAPGAAMLSAMSDTAIIGSPSINSYLALFATLVSVAPNIITNRKYRWLEQQEGFPHFSALLQEQQDRAKEFAEHDPYEEAARRRKLTESSSMNDVTLPTEKLAEKTRGSNDYMEGI